jgi:hypothetical protein
MNLGTRLDQSQQLWKRLSSDEQHVSNVNIKNPHIVCWLNTSSIICGGAFIHKRTTRTWFIDDSAINVYDTCIKSDTKLIEIRYDFLNKPNYV